VGDGGAGAGGGGEGAKEVAVAMKNLQKRVEKICLRLPEAFCEIHGEHVSFLVRKKTFAYYVNNHHGDGIMAVNCKVWPGDNAMLVNANPEKFYLPAYIASRGWVGLRLDTRDVDWGEVEDFIAGSYQLVTAKKLKL
jgi:predicted DNA-binding protein (MmcQ/YjbR family)